MSSKRLGKMIPGTRGSTNWGHDVERTATNPHGCPCGGDHSRARGEEKVAPVEAIVEASIEAKGAFEYQPGLQAGEAEPGEAGGRDQERPAMKRYRVATRSSPP